MRLSVMGRKRMISINLMTMEEYQPTHQHCVDLYLADRSWAPIVGIKLVTATCEIHYQQYDAKDRTPDSCWTSDTVENMDKIPFDTPFVHVTEPFEDDKDYQGCERIIGFRILEDYEFEKMAEAANAWKMLCSMKNFQKREDMTKPDAIDWTEAVEEAEAYYEPYKDVDVVYHQKQWFFNINSNHQIDQNDWDNEVLGIMDGEQLTKDLEGTLNEKGLKSV